MICCTLDPLWDEENCIEFNQSLLAKFIEKLLCHVCPPYALISGLKSRSSGRIRNCGVHNQQNQGNGMQSPAPWLWRTEEEEIANRARDNPKMATPNQALYIVCEFNPSYWIIQVMKWSSYYDSCILFKLLNDLYTPPPQMHLEWLINFEHVAQSCKHVFLSIHS